jgi:hypothetical protein
MREALGSGSATQRRAASKLDWRKKMSDNVAYALLVYTGLQIFVTMGALKAEHGSILPYFALVLLVVAIIPGLRLIERRWERLAESGAPREELAPLFRRDLVMLWTAAIGLPFVITGVVKLVVQLL